MENIQAKLQTFTGTMMVPIILPVLAGSLMGIGSAFTNYILPEGNILYSLFTMVTNLGFVFMNNLQLWFVVTIAFALVKKEKGWTAFAGLILFFCLMRGIEGWAALEGWTTETTAVDALVKSGYTQQAALNFNVLWLGSLRIYLYNMGVFSGTAIGLITVGPHNKFVGTKLPAVFGFSAGARFVIIMVTLASIPLAIAFYYVWPYVAGALQSITDFTYTSGLLGTFVLSTPDKMLPPFDIHHLIAFPIEYTKVGGAMMIDGVMYEDVKNIINGQAASAGATGYVTRDFTNGRLLFWLAGLPGTAFAMYHCIKPENKKKVASLLAPSVFTLTVVSTSEPIEYTFLFVVPALYWLVYALLCGLYYVAVEITNISVNGTALFFMIPSLFQPQKVRVMNALWLLPVTLIVYCFAFKFAITKFDLKTPGRDDKGEIKLMSKKEYNEIKNNGKDEANISSTPEGTLGARIIEALEEADNIETVACCANRLRITVKDDSLTAPDASRRNYLEAVDVVREKNSVQVIYDVRVVSTTAKVKDYLHLDQP